MLTITLVADKETPGTVRFAEPDATGENKPLTIYLRKEMVADLLGGAVAEIGVTAIKLTLDRA